MEFESYAEDLYSLICFIIFAIAIYVRKRYFVSPETVWEPIGYIKHIYIYPIEGGYRKEVNQVDCSKSNYGLTAYDCYNSFWEDRKYFIYSYTNENPELINLYNENFITLKTDILKNIQLEDIKAVKYPDGTITYVHDCSYQIDNVSTTPYDENNKFKLGSQNKYVKSRLSKFRRCQKNNGTIVSYKYLNPEFSMCSLVNDESVKDIKRRSANDELTHLNFRPNFVIEAPEYCEDKVKFLKIGTVEFCNVLPCAVNNYVNIDPDAGKSHNQQPYETLLENRKLKEVRSDITTTSDIPVFGITLDISSDGKINVGDRVYAKFLR